VWNTVVPKLLENSSTSEHIVKRTRRELCHSLYSYSSSSSHLHSLSILLSYFYFLTIASKNSWCPIVYQNVQLPSNHCHISSVVLAYIAQCKQNTYIILCHTWLFIILRYFTMLSCRFLREESWHSEYRSVASDPDVLIQICHQHVQRRLCRCEFALQFSLLHQDQLRQHYVIFAFV